MAANSGAEARRPVRTTPGRAIRGAFAGAAIVFVAFGASTSIRPSPALLIAALPSIAEPTAVPSPSEAAASVPPDFRFLPALAQRPEPSPPGGPSSTLSDATLPIRATFYYGWYPEAWKESGGTIASNFHPSGGSYDGDDPAVIDGQIRAMRHGGIGAAIASWWGPGTRTDGRLAELLAASRASGLAWAVNVELETIGDLDDSAIKQDLSYIADHYAKDPSYLRIAGHFVVFVSAASSDRCELADRWTQNNAVSAYLVIGAVPGNLACDHQPDDWFVADPAVADQAIGTSSYAISPGFWKSGESPRLDRDPARWEASVRAMVASGARFQLVGTFNQWGDGSAIESAREWASASGYGTYLDILHANREGGPEVQPAPSGDPVLVGAGAIASCDNDNDEATAQLVRAIDGTVFTVGDNALPSGSATDFRDCYGPSWGAFLDRTRPAAGSRDYVTPGAEGYFTYFGSAAGESAKGYYAFDAGAWRIYVLNSNCSKIGGCERGSPQESWLRSDLAAHRGACIGAYWQSPRFSSGRFADDERMAAFWQDLYDRGAEFVISGHDRNYQRYAPLTPAGRVDRTAGIREFVVGTGGAGHTALQPDPTGRREAGTDGSFGVLRLTLHPTGYEWQFVAAPSTPFTDSGAASGH